ncbi:YggT family protein [Bifidobacterium asteroides]|uniref:Hemolysin n=1 Tax=Bifidobacterium asteroides TaxID=1684 RepID=A0A318MF81_9BIFI|nr:YggT family protein [Bifidobacterium asteroides]PXY82581.1 hemolysin [Bifidobacterium asteroides]
MLVSFVRYLVDILIETYLLILFVRMILDWVLVLSQRWYPRGFMASLIRVIYALTEPPLRWLRRYIPPLPMGRIQLDVSFMVLYAALIIIQVLLG